MRGIIAGDYAAVDSPVGGFVRFKGSSLEVEAPAGAVADGGQCPASDAIANLIRRAVEVGRGRPGTQQAGRDKGRHGDDGRPLPVEPLLAGDAQQVELRARQLVNHFGELVEREDREGGGDGGGDGPSVHG